MNLSRREAVGTHHHRVTRIAKQGELAIFVNPGTEWGTVRESPFERRGNEREEFLDPV